MPETDLTTISGIGEDYAARLRDRGFESVADIRDAELADLEAVDGVGPHRAELIHKAATALDDAEVAPGAETDADTESDDTTSDADTVEAETAEADVDDNTPVRARIEPLTEYVAPGVWTDTPGEPLVVQWTTPLEEAIAEGRARLIRYHYADGSTETLPEA